MVEAKTLPRTSKLCEGGVEGIITVFASAPAATRPTLAIRGTAHFQAHDTYSPALYCYMLPPHQIAPANLYYPVAAFLHVVPHDLFDLVHNLLH